MGESWGEGEAGFIPHFRKGGQGGILEECDSKLCCAPICCLPALPTGRQAVGRDKDTIFNGGTYASNCIS